MRLLITSCRPKLLAPTRKCVGAQLSIGCGKQLGNFRQQFITDRPCFNGLTLYRRQPWWQLHATLKVASRVVKPPRLPSVATFLQALIDRRRHTMTMNRQRPPTSTQPQVNDSRIYSSKVVPTIRVQLKDSDDDRVLLVNEKDFDPDRYVRLELP